MIRAVLGTIMMRSIERDRPLPAWLRAIAGRSRRLTDLDRRLRTSHARLSASTAGLIEAAPAGLAARTVAALPLRPRTPAGRTLPLGGWTGIILAAIGVIGAAAAVTLLVYPSTAPPAVESGAVAQGSEGAADGPWAPETLISVLRAPDEVASGAFAGGLAAEAQRLRDDTRAAADFVLSRIRILGTAPRQSGG